MTQTSKIPLDYRPRLKVFKRGKVWYWDYYLPDGKRVQRPANDKEGIARERGKWKETLLIRGEFDDYERKRLGQSHQGRLTLEQSFTVYFDLTASRKTGKTLEAERQLIRQAFDWFSQEKKLVYLDELGPMEAEAYLAALRYRGLKRVSINNHLRLLKRIINKFVDLEHFEFNRLNRVKPLPLSETEKARKVVVNAADIVKILQTDTRDWNLNIRDIAYFILNTGLRVGEVMHLEWSDIDWEKRVLHLCCKPACPTRFGLGWRPKMGKERAVPLNSAALAVLQAQPRQATFGHFQDRLYPAQFVFPKIEVAINREKCREPLNKCFKCDYSPRCQARQILYTRCDNVRPSWLKLLRTAGVKQSYRLHDLRRTFNTYCLEVAGFTHNQASAVTGNTLRVNLEHYSTVLEEEVKRKIERLPFNEPQYLHTPSLSLKTE